jgi:hypothetical protein
MKTAIGQNEGDGTLQPYWKILFLVSTAIQFSPMNGLAADVRTLKAGAARVEITPDTNAIPRPFTSIHDPLYAPRHLSGQRE